MQLLKLRGALLPLLLLFVLCFSVGSANAVDVNARIKGTVTDPSGAVVPGATVTATNTATNVKYPTKATAPVTTSSRSSRSAPTASRSAPPASRHSRPPASSSIIDQDYVEPVKLEVGNTSETLEVAADAVQVNTTDMQLSNIVDSTPDGRAAADRPQLHRTGARPCRASGCTSDRFAGTLLRQRFSDSAIGVPDQRCRRQ